MLKQRVQGKNKQLPDENLARIANDVLEKGNPHSNNAYSSILKALCYFQKLRQMLNGSKLPLLSSYQTKSSIKLNKAILAL